MKRIITVLTVFFLVTVNAGCMVHKQPKLNQLSGNDVAKQNEKQIINGTQQNKKELQTEIIRLNSIIEEQKRLLQTLPVTKGTIPKGAGLNDQYNIEKIVNYYKEPAVTDKMFTIGDFNAIQIGQSFDNRNNYQGIIANWKSVYQETDMKQGSNFSFLNLKAIGNVPNNYLEVWVDNSSTVVAVTRGGGV